MRIATLAGLAAVLVAGAALAAQTNVEAVNAKLDSTLVELSLENAPLTAAVEALHKATGINFVIDPAVFEKKPDAEFNINVQLKGIKAQSALNLLLGLYGLTSAYSNEVMLITRPDRIVEEPMTVVYEVFDLCEVRSERSYARDIAKGTPYRWSPVYSYIHHDYYFLYPSAYDRYLERYEPKALIEPETLMKMIMTTVPAKWGQDAGTGMGYANGLLVVRQAPSVQLEIAKLLYHVRKRH